MKRASFLTSTVVVTVLATAAYYYRTQVEILSGIALVFWYKLQNTVGPYHKVNWLQDLEDKSRRLEALGVSPDQIPAITKQFPNILVILADDLGFNDLSDYSLDPDFYGPRLGVDTPNINSIRRNGVNFEQSYSGHSTCTPSRSAMYTGRFPTKTGVEFTPVPRFFTKFATTQKDNASPQPIYHAEDENKIPPMWSSSIVPKSIPMLSEILGTVGYKNFFFGKWDNGYGPERSPLARGFDESLSFQVGASLYLEPNDPRLVKTSDTIKFDSFLTKILSFYVEHNNGPRFAPDEYMTDYLSTETVNLIHSLKSSNSQAPWYINLAYNAPHNPFQALKTDYDAPELAHIPTGIHRVYAAMIRALDRGVGRVLQALRDTDQYDNTLIIFTSDNGGADYTGIRSLNSPLRGWKLSLFEGGIRVPFFMQWPAKIAAGLVATRPVSHIDIVPSVVNIINNVLQRHTKRGIETKPIESGVENYEVDGESVFEFTLPSATSANSNNSDSITDNLTPRSLFWRSGHYKALRYGVYKLQIALHPDKVWFYRLDRDPSERYNLAHEVGVLDIASLNEVCHSPLYQNISSLSHQQLLFFDDESNPTSPFSSDAKSHAILKQLCLTYHKLEQKNDEQLQPRWPALGEIPICIDKHAGQKCLLSDDYVIVPN